MSKNVSLSKAAMRFKDLKRFATERKEKRSWKLNPLESSSNK